MFVYRANLQHLPSFFPWCIKKQHKTSQMYLDDCTKPDKYTLHKRSIKDLYLPIRYDLNKNVSWLMTISDTRWHCGVQNMLNHEVNSLYTVYVEGVSLHTVFYIPPLPAGPARGRRSACRGPRASGQRRPSGWSFAGPECLCAPHCPAAPELCLPCHRWRWRCRLKGYTHTQPHE